MDNQMRLPDCINYHACLTDHAHQNTDFDCNACQLYQPGPFITDPYEIAGATALLVAVFHPAVFSQLGHEPRFKTRLFEIFVDGLDWPL